MIINLLFITFLLFLITYTSSRTSFVASLVTLFFGLSLVSINAIRHKRMGMVIAKSVFILPFASLFLFAVYLIFPLQEAIGANIISKFERKSLDILDGRGAIWKYTFDEAGFFWRRIKFFLVRNLGWVHIIHSSGF